MTLQLLPASPAHIGRIACNMRTIDRVECAAFGLDPRTALRRGLRESQRAWTAKVDGRPAAMFGVVTVSAIEGLGRPWMLGTDEVYSHGRALLAMGPALIAAMLDSTPSLSNLVSAGNARAIRLLGRWGFTIDEERQMIGDTQFRTFWMAR